jgi:hypothetical protein
MLGLDDVVELEVAEQQPHIVQIAERGQDLEHIGDRLGRREGVGLARVRLTPRRDDLLQAPPAHVLHDDVPRALVLDEVEDLDDVGMLDLGQEASLGQRRLHRVAVAGVEQPLEHHPAVGDVAILGQVDPAHATVGETADDLVLAGDDVARAKLRVERERSPALAAEARGAAGRAVATAPDRLIAAGAEAPVLRDHRGEHHCLRRIADGHGRDLHQPRPEAAAPARPRPSGARAPRRGERCHRGRARPLRRRRTRRRHTACIAVAIHDRAVTARLLTVHRNASGVEGKAPRAS